MKKAYTILAYRPTNQGGGLLLETVHSTAASRDVEIAALRERMRRGEVGCIDVIDHTNPFGHYSIKSMVQP